MAWSTMHFAVGMGCTGVAAVGLCTVLRRGWRWIPAAMTAGGVWALIPDMTRVFREDFPNAPFAHVLGHRSLENFLLSWGDLFFFHRALDAQSKEYALLGLTMLLILYNAAIAGLMWAESVQRNSLANRAYRAHKPYRRRRRERLAAAPGPEAVRPRDEQPAVLHRIRPGTIHRHG